MRNSYAKAEELSAFRELRLFSGRWSGKGYQNIYHQEKNYLKCYTKKKKEKNYLKYYTKKKKRKIAKKYTLIYNALTL